MKKTLLIVAAAFSCFCGYAQSLYGEMPNGAFEDWTNDTIFEDLNEWNTANGNNPFVPTVFKSTDAQDGNFSARMETYIIGTDTLFGFVIIGNIDDNGPEPGAPFVSPADSIVGWYKCDVQPGDTAIGLLTMFFNGAPVIMQTMSFTGVASTWTRFAYPVGPTISGTDSVSLAFASSNAFNESTIQDGSWLMVDNISFVFIGGTTDNVPDPSFESWNSVVSETPDQWWTFNPFLAGGGIVPVRKIAGPVSGTFALEMETMDIMGDTIPGIITNGTPTNNGVVGGISYGAYVDSLHGYYKYAPVGGEIGFMNLMFKSGIDTITNENFIFTSAATWTEFSIPIFHDQLMPAPDSMQITAFAGNNPGSILSLDELELRGGTVSVDDLPSVFDAIKVYPNPSNGLVNFEVQLNNGTKVDFTLYDAVGKQVKTAPLGLLPAGTTTVQFNLNDLSNGIYIYTLQTATGSSTGRLIVQ